MKSHKGAGKQQFPAKSKPTHPVAAGWGDGEAAIKSGGKGKNAGMQMPSGVMPESGKP